MELLKKIVQTLVLISIAFGVVVLTSEKPINLTGPANMAFGLFFGIMIEYIFDKFLFIRKDALLKAIQEHEANRQS